MPAENIVFNNVNILLRALFEREEVFLQKRERSMIDQYTQAGGNPDGFRHLGVIYSLLQGGDKARGTYGCLPVGMIPEMDQVLAEKATMAADKERIRQALTLVMRDCKTFQDMRDALPNALKEFIPGAQRLERTRPEGYTLQDNPRAYSQYMKLREKIEFYIATRLLY
jgi:hypothetical protein